MDTACAPEGSLNADTRILLDDGQYLCAHAVYLRRVSEVFAGALTCSGTNVGGSVESAASQQLSEISAITHILPLPGATMPQALLLVHYLYSWTPESWAKGLSRQSLLELARVADKYACTSVLALVDSTLVQQCEEQDLQDEDSVDEKILTAASAPAQHKLARKLHLTGYEALAGSFLGRHVGDIDISQVDASYANILHGANLLRADMLASLFMS